MANLLRLVLACAFTLALIGCGFEHGDTVEPDAPPNTITVSFGAVATTVEETEPSVMIPVTLSSVSTTPVTVDFTIGAGTATRPDDYTLSDGTLTFMPGQTQQVIEIAITSDAIEENDETIIVQLAQPVGASLGADASHTVTISADILPRVSFVDATASSANEATSPQVELQLTLAPKDDVTVEIGVAGTASAADRAITDGHVVTFTAGTTSAMVPLGVVQDTLDEDDETIMLSLKNPSASLRVAATSATRMHTIADDDLPPAIAFAQASTSVNEATTMVTLSVQLSAASGKTVTVPFTVGAASTADNPDDYTLPAAMLTIPAGMTSANISVNVKADTLDEANETVIVTLGTPTNATLGATATATLTINDDDPPPTVEFTSNGSMPNENNTPIALTVQLSDISGQDVTVPYTIDVASTATDPDDYTIAPASPITIPAGQTSTTITIMVKEDAITEPDETVIVVLGTPTAATLGMRSTYTLKIKDDD